ncbi:hypothetical protein B5P45_00380 [Phyllobacterium zundukense]|uniref:Uncharacterized protein n=1 Tax=Phyllobacterium zundukense TaxID=1867719 RepID=A0A2N9W3I2_9HYPH|nr:hypothetical protein BLM14_11675 [Phyllobacterium zundukense]PIO46300.1 hypothetical protein B5P45_00380 [Phyllobacterium zundukense]
MRWRTIIIAGVRGKFISLMKFINPVHVNFPPRLIFSYQIRHFMCENRALSRRIEQERKFHVRNPGADDAKTAETAVLVDSAADINLTVVQLNFHSYEGG